MHIVPTQVKKMRAELATLNDCAVPFLSRAAVNLCWYYTSVHIGVVVSKEETFGSRVCSYHVFKGQWHDDGGP